MARRKASGYGEASVRAERGEPSEPPGREGAQSPRSNRRRHRPRWDRGGCARSRATAVELDLARQFAVSRVPLREAMKILEAQGILEREAHRGVRVVELDETRIDRICEVRAALEIIAARYAVKTYQSEPGFSWVASSQLSSTHESMLSGAAIGPGQSGGSRIPHREITGLE